MDRLIIGPFEFEDPQVAYSAGGPGIAVMGASLLHRFTAVFDYSRERLILEPNANFDKPPMVDRSGAFLVMSAAGDGTFEVLFVADGTPAHEAGLSRGDVIQAVDGVPTLEIRLNETRAMFCRPKKYRLEVQRDGRKLETVIETRSLFND
jgi:C-terminal processing protease CtpA/Prc